MENQNLQSNDENIATNLNCEISGPPDAQTVDKLLKIAESSIYDIINEITPTTKMLTMKMHENSPNFEENIPTESIEKPTTSNAISIHSNKSTSIIRLEENDKTNKNARDEGKKVKFAETVTVYESEKKFEKPIADDMDERKIGDSLHVRSLVAEKKERAIFENPHYKNITIGDNLNVGIENGDENDVENKKLEIACKKDKNKYDFLDGILNDNRCSGDAIEQKSSISSPHFVNISNEIALENENTIEKFNVININEKSNKSISNVVLVQSTEIFDKNNKNANEIGISRKNELNKEYNF